MARNRTRVFLTMMMAAAVFVACLGAAASAFALPGDSQLNATALNPYFGSELTTALVGNTGAGHNTAYWFKVSLEAGDTLQLDVTSQPINLVAILAYGTFPSSTPISPTKSRLTFGTSTDRAYSIYLASSLPGTFTIEPYLVARTTLSGTSGTKTTGYNAPLAIDGYLRAGTKDLGEPVSLYSSPDGKTWTQTPTVVTTSAVSGDIRYRAMVQRVTKYSYRFKFGGSEGYAPSWGPVVTVYPKVSLSIPATPSSVYHAKTFTTYSFLKPRHSVGSKPVRIYFYRWNGKSYVYVKYVWATAANYSTYTKASARVALSATGKYKVATYHPADGANAATWSYSKYMWVK